MLLYQKLVEQFSKEVKIVEMHLEGNSKGFRIKNTLLIDSRLSEKEKVETLLEEWAHYKTSTGNILNLNNVWNSKQEQQAMDYAVKHFVPVKDIKKAYDEASIDKDDYEIAENLNITPYMLKEAYKYYVRKGKKKR